MKFAREFHGNSTEVLQIQFKKSHPFGQITQIGINFFKTDVFV